MSVRNQYVFFWKNIWVFYSFFPPFVSRGLFFFFHIELYEPLVHFWNQLIKVYISRTNVFSHSVSCFPPPPPPIISFAVQKLLNLIETLVCFYFFALRHWSKKILLGICDKAYSPIFLRVFWCHVLCLGF